MTTIKQANKAEEKKVFSTGIGEVQFMAAARAFENKQTKKKEYSVRVLLDKGDEAIGHLLGIQPKKINTDNNRARNDGHKVVNFVSTFAPQMTDAKGNKLSAEEVPFFDSRIDTAKVKVTYVTPTYGDTQIVRLHGIQIMEMTLAKREGESSIAEHEANLEALTK
jgi:hypothetical protein